MVLQTAQNSSHTHRTIQTGKRRLGEDNCKMPGHKPVISITEDVNGLEKDKPGVNVTAVTIIKPPHVLVDSPYEVQENIKSPLNKIGWGECALCVKTFKSEATSLNHDKKFHMTQGTVNKYKCDNCSETFKSTTQIFGNIKNYHQKCTICARIFPEAKSLETHVKAVHKNAIYKHTLERDPSLKNHKNKRFI